MIHYDLTCPNGHNFDSWFQSAEAFDALQAAGHLSCAICGAAGIEKRIMAPAVRPARKAGDKPKLKEPASDLEAAMAEMRRQIEANSDYVGLNFAAEALSALTNLGYAPSDAASAVAQASDNAEATDTAKLIRAALRLLAPKT
mgnify:CR=1 FL=1